MFFSFRIMVVDHDLVSFADLNYKNNTGSSLWPIVVVTNPKNAGFLFSKEPFYRIKQSTHIR